MSRWLFRKPPAVLHVGAHLAEEAELYSAAGWGPVIWVEAQSDLVEKLVERFVGSPDLVLQGCAWSSTGKQMTLNVSSNSQSSSVFSLGTHKNHYPEIDFVGSEKVSTIRLDELIPGEARLEFVNLDIQGAELEALKGLGNRIRSATAVYVEVNREELYEGIPLVSEIDGFLKIEGFLRVVTVWTSAQWGDALYLRPGRFLSNPLGRALFAATIHFAIDMREKKRQLQKKRLNFLRRIVRLKNRVF